MAKRVQIVGHDNPTTFTGKEREVTVDVSKNELRVHDEVEPGGHRIPNESAVILRDLATAANRFLFSTGVNTWAAQTVAQVRRTLMTSFNAATNNANKLTYLKLIDRPTIPDVSTRVLLNLANVSSSLTAAEKRAFQVKAGISPTIPDLVPNDANTRLQWDGREANFRKYTLTQDWVLNAIGFPLEGAVYAAVFTQDATGGHEVTHTSSFYSDGAQSSALATEANAINLLTWFYFSGKARLISNVVISD